MQFPRNFLLCHLHPRLISSTRVCRKQPPHDRQRYKRHQPEPRHRLPFVDEAPLDRLPEKPMQVTGSLGSLEPNIKTLGYKQIERLKQLPTTFDKLQELFYYENNFWYHSLDIPLQSYGTLEFVQQLTRTNLEQWNPEFNEYPVLHSYLKCVLTEELTLLNRFPVNEIDQRPEAVQARSERRSAFICSLLEAVYRMWVQTPSGSHLVRQPHQIDEGATVETFLKRKTPKALFENPPDISEDIFENVDDTVWDSSDHTVRYRIRSRLAWQLRGSEPLQPFISWEHPVCVQDKLPRCMYRPEAFDWKPVECLRFSCLPYTESPQFSGSARSIAGYWTHSPFWHGDPCEFGHVGAMDLGKSESVHRAIGMINQPVELIREIRMLHGLSEALLTAFAWTSAQAYNKGFTLYNELTYPFAGQLLLFDGEQVQILRYQLNSLTSLWKPEEAGLPFNVAWYSPQLQLFEFDQSTKTLNSVNPQAVSLIASAFLHPTECGRSITSLQPYLSTTSHGDTRSANDEYSYQCLIPNSSTAATEHTGDKSESLISKFEHAAWEATKDTSPAHPLRLHSSGAPHPNEVYFFKETKKADLIAEFKEEMPSFGGSFAKLPEPYESIVKAWDIARRNRQPRSRVQAPPRRWR